jgi:CubicO group peptidase (beta-lactamase class C family)
MAFLLFPAGEASMARPQQKHSPASKSVMAKMSMRKSAAAGPVTAPPTTPAELTTADLSAFFDGMVPLQIERDDIAGAVIAVVKDGQVIFAKGYGYADLKNEKPVSADDTLFRVGSISKLFTWTAVMQLVQDGKINLDADINQYLDFHIPATFGKPITMRDLMTHTPGFEEAIKDLISLDAAKIPSIADYLKGHLPEQIFPPGTVGAYSNYGATLAGYIVQRISGEPFDDYIEHHIFQPLDMTHASFRQPLPANLQPLMSQGFQMASGGAKPFEIVTAAPAGALSISAMDITHFMIAHLQDGTYNGAQILRPETVKEMHTRQYAPDPKVNGMCLGFYEESRNGHRVIGHGGDTIYFHSDLHLIQDANVGLFVSYNSAGRGDVEPRGPLFQQFMDRYFPYTPPQTPPVATAKADAEAVSGTYIPSRRPQTNILYLLALLGEAKVSPGKDGTLVIAGQKGINGQPTEWHEAAQNVWYDPADPQTKMVFSRDPSGHWQIALEFPAEMLQQVNWYQSKGFVLNSLIGILAIFALTLILWPIAAFTRWHYGQKFEVSDREQRARAWARVECALDLIFWVAFVGTIASAGTHLNILSHSTDSWFRVIQIIGWLGVIGTLLAIWNFFVSVGTSGRWWWAKVHDTLIVLACLMSVWLIWFTHLLHFSLKY